MRGGKSQILLSSARAKFLNESENSVRNPSRKKQLPCSSFSFVYSERVKSTAFEESAACINKPSRCVFPRPRSDWERTIRPRRHDFFTDHSYNGWVRIPPASSRTSAGTAFGQRGKSPACQSEKPFARVCVYLYAQVSDPLQGRPHHCGTNRARICAHTRRVTAILTYFQLPFARAAAA